ncbi:hypothetical protein Sjap_018595 [Stephania japonica]|uniref:Uncharacterized protein n=1 Tax=Stephania japonica TaxID=461633 RepID=A0AAP0I8E5_9MAGN
MYEVKGEGQKRSFDVIYTNRFIKKKPIHTLFIFSFDENRRPLLLFHLDLFTTPLTVSLSPSPFHSRCSLTFSHPSLSASRRLTLSVISRLEQLSPPPPLSLVRSVTTSPEPSPKLD